MRSELKFKNRSSKEFGILAKCPHIPPAAHRIQVTEIPGGSPIIYDDGLKAIQTPNYDIGIIDANETKVLNTYAWLNGMGDLWLSCEPNVYFRNAVVNNVSVEYLSRKSAKISVNFMCDSYRYAVENPVETLEFTKTSGDQQNVWVNNPGSAVAQPQYIVDTSGETSIFVGSKYITLNRSGITILNTEDFTMLDSNGNLIGINTDLHELLLNPGNNLITVDGAGFRSLKIKKNARW